MNEHKPHWSQKAAWVVLGSVVVIAILSAVSIYLKTTWGVNLHI